MASGPVIRFSSPCSLRHRGLAVRLVAEACRLVRGDSDGDEKSLAFDLHHPFDAEVVSAFAEIYNNIVLHAYGRRDGEIVEITIHIDGGSMIVEIRDSGASFDLSTVAEPDLDSLPEGGMGLHIARAMLDEVAYEPGPPNLWRLTKRHRPSTPS
jgi:serine/threonine-protein kinase RsbW